MTDDFHVVDRRTELGGVGSVPSGTRRNRDQTLKSVGFDQTVGPGSAVESFNLE